MGYMYIYHIMFVAFFVVFHERIANDDVFDINQTCVKNED